MHPLAVTGSTGHVGGRVARRLAAAGLPQLLLVRDPARAPVLPGASVARCDYAAPDAAALEGIATLFMVSATEAPDRREQHLRLVDAAAEAGVGHVVYLSFTGAGPEATFTLARDHGSTEERLRSSGLRWTVLRNNLYADVLPELAGVDGVLAGPAGDGRVAAVLRDDVAEAVTAVLRDPGAHVGATYELSGPEALTLAEVAAVLTEVTGRPHTYVAETLEQARASRAPYGVEEWQLQAWISTYTAIAAGEMARVTDDVERLTGHPATSLRNGLLSR